MRKYGLRDRRKHPPLPTVPVSNVQSIWNKTDEIEAYAREFPQLFFTLVYIPPQANISSATKLIAEVSNKLD
uniref:Uncharacterized protein n=1 Tax=Knipowitschia caucasica TaxID=637954 RepID=A0AAV2L837_KNICA